jgi:hypothetical protein
VAVAVLFETVRFVEFVAVMSIVIVVAAVVELVAELVVELELELEHAIIIITLSV